MPKLTKKNGGVPLTEAEVLELFRAGLYRVDLDTGSVYGRRGGAKPLHTFSDTSDKKRSDCVFVRIYFESRHRGVPVHRIVWMVGANSLIPPGWEVHHRDVNQRNNSFSNLYCLHPIDHEKIHRSIRNGEGGLIPVGVGPEATTEPECEF